MTVGMSRLFSEMNNRHTISESAKPPNADLPTTSVLLIDGNHTDRKYFVDQLKGSFPDYKILDATTGEEGLTLCRSRRFDCVVYWRSNCLIN